MVMTRWQAAQKKTGYKASQWFVEQKKRLAEQQLGQLGNAALARMLEWIAQLDASHKAAVARLVGASVPTPRASCMLESS